MFVSYKQFDKPQIFNYQLFQGIILALVWIYELTLIYLWFSIVLGFERVLNLINYGLGDEGNISC